MAESHFFQTSDASDYYVVNAIFPNWQDGDVVHPAAATGGQLALSDLDGRCGQFRDGPHQCRHDLRYTGSQNGPARIAPLMLDLSFPIERLFPALVSGGVAAGRDRRRQSVSPRPSTD